MKKVLIIFAIVSAFFITLLILSASIAVYCKSDLPVVAQKKEMTAEEASALFLTMSFTHPAAWMRLYVLTSDNEKLFNLFTSSGLLSSNPIYDDILDQVKNARQGIPLTDEEWKIFYEIEAFSESIRNHQWKNITIEERIKYEVEKYMQAERFYSDNPTYLDISFRGTHWQAILLTKGETIPHRPKKK